MTCGEGLCVYEGQDNLHATDVHVQQFLTGSGQSSLLLLMLCHYCALTQYGNTTS